MPPTSTRQAAEDAEWEFKDVEARLETLKQDAGDLANEMHSYFLLDNENKHLHEQLTQVIEQLEVDPRPRASNGRTESIAKYKLPGASFPLIEERVIRPLLVLAMRWISMAPTPAMIIPPTILIPPQGTLRPRGMWSQPLGRW